jgi:RHS repeat-associated protein
LAGTQGVVNSTYSYDLVGRLTNLTHQQGAVALAAYAFTYDAANRLTRLSGPNGTSDYNYDSRGQLLGNDHSTQSDEAYGYDANGNRTNSGYQTGTNNQLLSDGVYTYTYDQEGNRTSRTNIASGEVTEYTWDYRNRLTSLVVRATAGGAIVREVDYTYDVYDRRIAKVVDLDGVGSQAATTEQFIYDGEHIAVVFDKQGNVTERYLHGDEVDQVLAVEKSGQTQWFLTDHQGSIRQIVDETGAVINQIEYDSYGNIISQSNPNVTFRFGYTGREWDGETGQYYYRARYLDPFVGQFISQDPIGFNAGDTNLYRYVGNSPTNFTDPTGLISDDPWGMPDPLGLDPVTGWGYINVRPRGKDPLEPSGFVRPSNFNPTPPSTRNILPPARNAAPIGQKALPPARNTPPLGEKALPPARGSQRPLFEKSRGKDQGKGKVGSTCLDKSPFINLPQRGLFDRRLLDMDALRRSANLPYNKDLTQVGRALDKHASQQRGQSPFPRLSGSNANKNRVGAQQLNEILTHPNANFTRLGRGGIEVRLPDGRGVRYNADGTFSGFVD